MSSAFGQDLDLGEPLIDLRHGTITSWQSYLDGHKNTVSSKFLIFYVQCKSLYLQFLFIVSIIHGKHSFILAYDFRVLVRLKNIGQLGKPP